MALALIVLQRANLLILDEPTNHLDVESIEALEDAIEEYEGTVLLVSHDRALLRELSTRVWALENGRINDFGGTFVEWEQSKKDAVVAKRAADAVAADDRRAKEKSKSKANAATDAGDQASRKARNKELADAERAVQNAERIVNELKDQLADPVLYDGSGAKAKRATDLAHQLAVAERALEKAMAAWESVSRDVFGSSLTHLSDVPRRRAPVRFDYLQVNRSEGPMDTNTILIILLVVLLLGGGWGYSRRGR